MHLLGVPTRDAARGLILRLARDSMEKQDGGCQHGQQHASRGAQSHALKDGCGQQLTAAKSSRPTCGAEGAARESPGSIRLLVERRACLQQVFRHPSSIVRSWDVRSELGGGVGAPFGCAQNWSCCLGELLFWRCLWRRSAPHVFAKSRKFGHAEKSGVWRHFCRRQKTAKKFLP